MPTCWSPRSRPTAGRGPCDTTCGDAATGGGWRRVALVALSLWVFPPPAEYIVGGKDPGVYMNAGVQIAQRGSLVIDDELVASLPAETRGLFFPRHRDLPYYSNRFMGFFLVNPDTGTRDRPVPAPVPHRDRDRLRPRRAHRGPLRLNGLCRDRRACPLLSRREADWQAGGRRRRGSAGHPFGPGLARADSELGGPRAGPAARRASGAGASASRRRRLLRAGRGRVVGPAAVRALRRRAGGRPGRASGLGRTGSRAAVFAGVSGAACRWR